MAQLADYLNFLIIIFHFQHFVTAFFDKISTISQMPIFVSRFSSLPAFSFEELFSYKETLFRVNSDTDQGLSAII